MPFYHSISTLAVNYPPLGIRKSFKFTNVIHGSSTTAATKYLQQKSDRQLTQLQLPAYAISAQVTLMPTSFMFYAGFKLVKLIMYPIEWIAKRLI